MVYYITIVKPTYNWSAPHCMPTTITLEFGTLCITPTGQKEVGALGGTTLLYSSGFSWFSQHGWIVFRANGRWLVHPVPAIFYLLLTAKCSKLPLVVYFLIFATRVVAVMAIATSYNWWFLEGITNILFLWGDLLVLITELNGHHCR